MQFYMFHTNTSKHTFFFNWIPLFSVSAKYIHVPIFPNSWSHHQAIILVTHAIYGQRTTHLIALLDGISTVSAESCSYTFFNPMAHLFFFFWSCKNNTKNQHTVCWTRSKLTRCFISEFCLVCFKFGCFLNAIVLLDNGRIEWNVYLPTLWTQCSTSIFT